RQVGVEAGHRLDGALPDRVADVEVADLQQGLARPRSFSLGLRTRSSVWPASVKPRTTSTMPRPGGMKYHHAPRPTAPLTKAKWSMVPHDTWTGSPSPRNASVASARIEPAITSTAFAKMSGATFGRMWIPIKRRSLAPMDCT